MKDKLMLFIIGVLVGAVISTGAFYVYSKSNKCNNNNQGMQMTGGNPPSMPSGQNNNGQPPEKPDEQQSNNIDTNSNSTSDNE